LTLSLFIEKRINRRGLTADRKAGKLKEKFFRISLLDWVNYMMSVMQPVVSTFERPKIKTLPGLADIDTCRRRLLSARTRIEEAWPKDSHRRPKELPAQTAAAVAASLKRIPTPLPRTIGGLPEAVLPPEPYNLFTAVGRVFDAALTVLAVEDFDVLYNNPVTIYGSAQFAAAAALELSFKPTVGELTTKIFAEIEMISLALGI